MTNIIKLIINVKGVMMKHLIISIFLMFLISCSNGFDNTALDHNLNSPVYEGIYDVGDMHNAGVQYMASIWDSTWDLTNYQDFSETLSLICGFCKQNYSFDSADVYNSVFQYLLPLVTAEDMIDALEDSYENLRYSELWGDCISYNETCIVDAEVLILETDFTGMTHQQIANFIISKTDSIMDLWESIDWEEIGDTILSTREITYLTTNGSGNLSYGFLDICKHSAEYWKYNDPNPPADAQAFGALMYADGIGYVVSWIRAVKEDYDEKKDSGCWKRIQKGLNGAMEYSTGYALFKYFGL